MEQNFREWDTETVINWLYVLHEDFEDEYVERFQLQNIDGTDFNDKHLANKEWCNSELGMQPHIAVDFANVVASRMKMFQSIQTASAQTAADKLTDDFSKFDGQCYDLQDDGDNGWEFELDFSEWDTQVITQWIFILDEDFG
eukprot:206271_1